jgi:hypothetical protein
MMTFFWFRRHVDWLAEANVLEKSAVSIVGAKDRTSAVNKQTNLHGA